MKKSKRIKIQVVSLSIFLLIILFPNYIHSIQKKEKIPSEVIVGGELLQINMDTSKIMYYVKDDTKSKIKNYDLIHKIEGDLIKKIFKKKSIKNVTRKNILYIILAMNDNEKVKVTVLRNNKYHNIYLSKNELNYYNFRDSIPFSATLTYINPIDNSFGAVAHNIDVEKQDKVLCDTGNIYLCKLLQIKKSNTNKIGSMHGEKELQSQGKIKQVNKFGAKGIIKETDILENNYIYKVGKAKEVKNGSASLLIKPSGQEKKSYEINITKINKQNKPDIQGFEFEVVDKELIENYGGIVQGMSGCPIIQNGKIIGALSHVIINNPYKGVGLYVEWMMES